MRIIVSGLLQDPVSVPARPGAYAGIRFTIMPRNAWESKLTAGSIITANVLQLDYSPEQAVRLGRRHNMPPPHLDF